MHDGDELVSAVREQRQRFMDLVEPLRADLFRYCKALTGSVWDGEDLLQDTLLRGLALLAEEMNGVRNLRAYLFRTATNAWIDARRRHAPTLLPPELMPDEAAPSGPSPVEVGEALVDLASGLPPRERVAVLLRDVFGLDADEAGEAMGTSSGAVKAALHRGRAALAARREGAAPPPATRAVRRIAEPLLDEFVAAFSARDLPRLVALMDARGRSDIVGVARGIPESESAGTFVHTIAEDSLRSAVRAEVDGEEIIVLLYAAEGDPDGVVGDVVRVEVGDGLCLRSRSYYYCPEVLEEVACALGRAARSNGCRPG